MYDTLCSAVQCKVLILPELYCSFWCIVMLPKRKDDNVMHTVAPALRPRVVTPQLSPIDAS